MLLPAIIDFITHAITQYIWPALAVVVTLGIAILLHEFGHFIVARLVGVRAETFSIGFGKTLWSRTWGGTEYRIAAFPLGGFVRLPGMLSEEAERYLMGEDEEGEKKEGEGDGEAPEAEAEGQPKDVEEELSADTAGGETEAESEKEGESVASLAVRDAMKDSFALRNKIWPLRVAVFAAGCGFNFLVAATIYSMLAWVGTVQDMPFRSFVADVQDGSAVYEAGLRSQDRIIRIGGAPVERWSKSTPESPQGILEVLAERLKAKNTKPIETVVERKTGDTTNTVALTLPNAKTLIDELTTGTFGQLMAPACIGAVYPLSAASKAGLKENDVVLAIDDKPVERFRDLVDIVSASPGKALVFRVRRDDKETTLSITPRESDEGRGQIGVQSGNVERFFYRWPFFEAWRVGFRQTTGLTKNFVLELGKVFGRGFKSMKKNLAGPVGIVSITYQNAKRGFAEFLRFMAFLNIALMIFNLLPIPILDGGHILITTIESVLRRPIPPRLLAGMYYAFFFLIIGFALMVTMFDVLRFVNY